MNRNNPLLDKSFVFAIDIVQACRNLKEQKKEFVLSKQLIRSGTAIGALSREAQNAESKKDFIHKLQIAQKECDETIYWIELLEASNYINKETSKDLGQKATELLKLLRSIIISTKRNL